MPWHRQPPQHLLDIATSETLLQLTWYPKHQAKSPFQLPKSSTFVHVECHLFFNLYETATCSFCRYDLSPSPIHQRLTIPATHSWCHSWWTPGTNILLAKAVMTHAQRAGATAGRQGPPLGVASCEERWVLKEVVKRMTGQLVILYDYIYINM